MLLPPSIADWVPADHEVHFIADAVGQLDLSAIMEKYNEPRGNPPYHPQVMVGILLYAYARGVRGSRRIERMCYEDVPMRVLAGNVQPDHWTIAAFRRRHLEALGELFVQTVLLAQKAGVVKMGHLAIDGTKVKANASKHSAMSYGRMKEERARLEALIRKELQAGIAEDEREDAELGDRRGDELPPELAHPAKRLAAIKEAMASLEAEAAAKQAQQPEQAAAPARKRRKKSKPKGGSAVKSPSLLPPEEPVDTGTPPAQAEAIPVVPDKAQYNFTDPESRIMLTSSKAFEQCYNAQAAVDSPSQIIVAADLTNQAADAPHLRGVVDQVIANTGRAPPARPGPAATASLCSCCSQPRLRVAGTGRVR